MGNKKNQAFFPRKERTKDFSYKIQVIKDKCTAAKRVGKAHALRSEPVNRASIPGATRYPPYRLGSKIELNTLSQR